MGEIVKKQRKFLKHIVASSVDILKLSVGNFGICAIENGSFTYDQLETVRKILLFKLQKKGYFLVKVVPSQSVTNKSLGTRMGSGKGTHNHFIYKVRCGEVLFEFSGISKLQEKKLLILISKVLPFKIKGLFINF